MRDSFGTQGCCQEAQTCPMRPEFARALAAWLAGKRRSQWPSAKNTPCGARMQTASHSADRAEVCESNPRFWEHGKLVRNLRWRQWSCWLKDRQGFRCRCGRYAMSTPID